MKTKLFNPWTLLSLSSLKYQIWLLSRLIRHQVLRIFAILIVCILLGSTNEANAQPVTVTITSDNAYVYGFGNQNGITDYHSPGVCNITAGQIYNAVEGTETYTINSPILGGYIYIAAWSDNSSLQGLIAEFSDGVNTVRTSPTPSTLNPNVKWEVYATGDDLPIISSGSTIPYGNLNCPPLGIVGTPNTTSINGQIALANIAGGNPSTTSIGWVQASATNIPGRVGVLAFGPNNVGASPNFPPGTVSGITPLANWMWYYPTATIPNLTSPFYSNSSAGREYYIFRIGPISDLPGFGNSDTCSTYLNSVANLKVGTCDSCNDEKVTIKGGAYLDHGNENIGTLAKTLKFGDCGTGEAIGSKRNAGGNQNGLDFYTNNLNRMVVANNGNVGVGTISPQQNLSVENGINIDQSDGDNGTWNGAKALSFGSYSGEGIGSVRSWAFANPYGLDFFTAGARRMVVHHDGNIGIGTVSPSQKLHIHDGAVMVSGTNSFGGPMILFSDDTLSHPNGRWGIEYDYNAHGLNFWKPYNTGGPGAINYNMFLKDNGNIGINNSTPGNKLEITSNSISPTPSGLRFTNLTSSSASVTPVTPNVLSVDANGDVILVPPCCSNPSSNFWSRNATTSTIYPTNTSSLGDKLALGTSSVLTTNPNLYPGGFNARLKLNGGDLVIQEDLTSNVGSPDEGADLFLIDKNGNGLDLGAQNDNAELVAFGANTSINFSTPGAYHGMIMHGDGTNKGKVQIGNVTTPGNYLLYVEKGILTEKVKVAVKGTANWADHVFASDYKLKSLDEIEDYINENNHLPGVPSANELVSEGLDLGEMQAKQMEKIEELTLYLIEMKKEITLLKSENAALKISNPKN